ncbi:MAG: type I pullulanase [Sphingobacteriales bacterium]|nr:type I pullulanase [Sphingobacteriales bacterium]
MKKGIMIFGFIIQLFSGKAQKSEYDKYPVYTGSDLGVTYTKGKTTFKIWAPTANEVELDFYKKGVAGTIEDMSNAVSMEKEANGVWSYSAYFDIKGTFYVFRVNIDGRTSDDISDPYAKAIGINGKRAMVVNLKETNPPGWEKDRSPVFKNPTDAVIYELHVRDASIAANSGIKNKGKFLGLTENGTKNSDGLSTGLDHLKELGVTHIHLLPFYDYNSVDETKPDAKYNWGYDPLNYNVPEGSYSTNANDPLARIKEFKQLVQAFHKNGLRVVMDVVYNHTALTEKSNFNQLVPDYYYRQTKDGKFSNATACGNETASERPMMRKFILESMKYWVQEYHIDGFRIDLMGVHDIETMNLISKELHKIKPDILLYGEGWTAGASPLPDSLRALKANVSKLDRIAVFSDDIRDGIKGHVFTYDAKGFASGQPGTEESVKFGIVAACKHPQVDYKKVNYSKKPYAAEPYQTITYAECHDNHCLWDKLAISNKDATEAEREEMQKLALSIVLTSQGISFLHAGSEFLRSKKGVENSFESPDSINAIDWSLKTKNKNVFEYVKALIKMRKEHPAFRMTTAKQIASNIKFLEGLPAGVIAYTMNGSAVADKWKKIFVAFNGTGKDISITAQPGSYKCFVAGNMVSETIGGYEGYWRLDAYSCSIMYQE